MTSVEELEKRSLTLSRPGVEARAAAFTGSPAQRVNHRATTPPTPAPPLFVFKFYTSSRHKSPESQVKSWFAVLSTNTVKLTANIIKSKSASNKLYLNLR